MSKSRNEKKREWAEEHQDSLPGPSSLNSKERRHIKRKLAAAGRDLEADYEPPDAVIYEDEEEEYEPPDAIVEEPESFHRNERSLGPVRHSNTPSPPRDAYEPITLPPIPSTNAPTSSTNEANIPQYAYEKLPVEKGLRVLFIDRYSGGVALLPGDTNDENGRRRAKEGAICNMKRIFGDWCVTMNGGRQAEKLDFWLTTKKCARNMPPLICQMSHPPSTITAKNWLNDGGPSKRIIISIGQDGFGVSQRRMLDFGIQWPLLGRASLELHICHDSSTNTSPGTYYVPSVNQPPQKFYAAFNYFQLCANLCELASDYQYQDFIQRCVEKDAARQQLSETQITAINQDMQYPITPGATYLEG